MTSRRLIGAVFLAVMLPGCLFNSPPTEFFVLEPRTGEDVRQLETSRPLGVRSITLPPELDRSELVRDIGPGRVEVLGTRRWAAPLDDLVYHAFVLDLAARLSQVLLPGQPEPDVPTRSLDVTIEQLTAGPGKNLTLRARWTVTAPDHQLLLKRDTHIQIPLSSRSDATVAQAMSRALADLADDVAKGVARLDRAAMLHR